jgi:hypothetical protein
VGAGAWWELTGHINHPFRDILSLDFGPSVLPFGLEFDEDLIEKSAAVACRHFAKATHAARWRCNPYDWKIGAYGVANSGSTWMFRQALINSSEGLLDDPVSGDF